MWLCFTKARNEGWLFCFLSKHHFQGLVHRYFQVFFTYSLTPATISDIWPLKNTSTKKKNYVSTTQETEQPHPGLRSTWTPDCKHRQERKKAFAYCGGKNSKFSPFKDKYQGRALPFFFLFFFPIKCLQHFACDGCFQICMNDIWHSNRMYKTVPSLSHVTVLGDTVKSLFSSLFLQPEEKNVDFFCNTTEICTSKTSIQWMNHRVFWINCIEDSAKSSSVKSRIFLQVTERTTKVKTTRYMYTFHALIPPLQIRRVTDWFMYKGRLQ